MEKLTYAALMSMVIAVAVTLPADIVYRVEFQDTLGNFASFYELSDKTVVEKKVEIRNPGTPSQELVISGFYYYIAPDGVPQLTEYVADKDGDRRNTTSGQGATPPRVAATMLG